MCDLRKMTHCQRTVTRAYGGNLCHKCLQDRYTPFALSLWGSILRAFLIEEQKIVKKVAQMKAQQKKEDKSAKKASKKSAKKTGKK